MSRAMHHTLISMHDVKTSPKDINVIFHCERQATQGPHVLARRCSIIHSLCICKHLLGRTKRAH